MCFALEVEQLPSQCCYAYRDNKHFDNPISTAICETKPNMLFNSKPHAPTSYIGATKQKSERNGAPRRRREKAINQLAFSAPHNYDMMGLSLRDRTFKLLHNLMRVTLVVAIFNGSAAMCFALEVEQLPSQCCYAYSDNKHFDNPISTLIV